MTTNIEDLWKKKLSPEVKEGQEQIDAAMYIPVVEPAKAKPLD